MGSSKFLPEKKKQAIYGTLTLWKKVGARWSNDELVPVKKLIYSAKDQVDILFVNGNRKIVKFD